MQWIYSAFIIEPKFLSLNFDTGMKAALTSHQSTISYIIIHMHVNSIGSITLWVGFMTNF